MTHKQEIDLLSRGTEKEERNVHKASFAAAANKNNDSGSANSKNNQNL